LPVVRAVAATTRLVVLVAGSLLVRVEAIVAQLVLQVKTVPVLALRKRMATLLVLVEVEQQLIRVAVAVVIGAVGVRLNRRN
jgi:Flp pilus assembly CpaF family ATPase